MSPKITRKKGQSGRAKVLQCIQCRKIVPREKVVEKRQLAPRLGHRLRSILKKQDAYISGRKNIVYYCVSCAKHRKYV